MNRVAAPRRARIYDPATGQFTSRDPIVSLTRSAYGYVYGNPLNATDPSGLDTIGACGFVQGFLPMFSLVQQWCPAISISDSGHVQVGSLSTRSQPGNNSPFPNWPSATAGVSSYYLGVLT